MPPTREPDPDNAGGGSQLNETIIVVAGAAPLDDAVVAALPRERIVLAARRGARSRPRRGPAAGRSDRRSRFGLARGARLGRAAFDHLAPRTRQGRHRYRTRAGDGGRPQPRSPHPRRRRARSARPHLRRDRGARPLDDDEHPPGSRPGGVVIGSASSTVPAEPNSSSNRAPPCRWSRRTVRVPASRSAVSSGRSTASNCARSSDSASAMSPSSPASTSRCRPAC